jgi:hypothetical protein
MVVSLLLHRGSHLVMRLAHGVKNFEYRYGLHVVCSKDVIV